MSDILQRLDNLRTTIQNHDFLNGLGLANEINIRFFPYEPQDELAVRYWVKSRKEEKYLACNLLVHNLFDIVLNMVNELGYLHICADLELSEGKHNLQQAIMQLVPPSAVAQRISRSVSELGKDVIMICGVGEVYPFIRIHTLLESLQPLLPNRLPVLVMYPGSFNNHSLQLFKTFTPNGYYRAFNLL